MTAAPRHWAAVLIGKPWRSAARGPREYSCWGLAQRAVLLRQGLQLPDFDNEDSVVAIRRGAETGGWRLVAGPAVEDDVLVMRNKFGQRHVGYMVVANGRLGVLHADGHDTPTGPVGCVVWQTLADTTAGGYHDFEVWRHFP